MVRRDENDRVLHQPLLLQHLDDATDAVVKHSHTAIVEALHLLHLPGRQPAPLLIDVRLPDELIHVQLQLMFVRPVIRWVRPQLRVRARCLVGQMRARIKAQHHERPTIICPGLQSLGDLIRHHVWRHVARKGSQHREDGVARRVVEEQRQNLMSQKDCLRHVHAEVVKVRHDHILKAHRQFLEPAGTPVADDRRVIAMLPQDLHHRRSLISPLHHLPIREHVKHPVRVRILRRENRCH